MASASLDVFVWLHLQLSFFSYELHLLSSSQCIIFSFRMFYDHNSFLHHFNLKTLSLLLHWLYSKFQVEQLILWNMTRT